MQITIVDVAPAVTKTASTGRQYQEIELMFKDNTGKPSSRKIMSFTQDLFRAVQGLQRGANVYVNRQKNDKTGYWDWVSIGEGAPEVGQQPQQQASASPTTRVAGSNYETKEERAARQVMIVRQSSLSTAVSALGIGGKTPIDVNQVIDYAKVLEAYVLGLDKAVDFESMEDDIPA
jgi:hypothetical protein